MIEKIQRTIILGGRGQMARLLVQYLPSPITLIDTKTFEQSEVSKYLPSDRAVRRHTSSELKAASKDDKADAISSICILSLPGEVYRQAANVPGNSKLSYLLGVSGRGYKSTLFIHQTSVHSLPSEVLEPLSGVVLGVHLLHGPSVRDFQDETVIVTASENKKKHDRHNSGFEIISHILRRRMGYKHVFQMSPERHDTIMANIQFLTHSMLLILGDALASSNYTITPDNYHELPSSIFILLGRMKKQPHHVYKGIATGNNFNEVVSLELKKLKETNDGAEADWLCSAIRKFGEIRDHLVEETSMTQKEQERICTPMSRTRDGIINHARRCKKSNCAEINHDIKVHVDRYLSAVASGYEEYFSDVMEKIGKKLDVLDFESLTMKKYHALR